MYYLIVVLNMECFKQLTNMEYTKTINPNTEESNALYMLGYELVEFAIINPEWNDWLDKTSETPTYQDKVDLFETVIIRQGGFLMLDSLGCHPKRKDYNFTAYRLRTLWVS